MSNLLVPHNEDADRLLFIKTENEKRNHETKMQVFTGPEEKQILQIKRKYILSKEHPEDNS